MSITDAYDETVDPHDGRPLKPLPAGTRGRARRLHQDNPIGRGRSHVHAETAEAIEQLEPDHVVLFEPGDKYKFLLAVVIPLVVFIQLTVPMVGKYTVPTLFIAGVAGVIGLITLKWALEEPIWLMLLFLTYMPFQRKLPGDFGGMMEAFNFTNVFLVLLLFALITRHRIRNDKLYTPHRLDFPIILFCIISSVALFRGEMGAGHPSGEILNNWKRWMVPFLVYFLFANLVTSKKQIRLLVLTVCLIVVAMGLAGLKEGYIDRAGFGKLSKRRISLATTPNDLGAFYAYYTPVLMAFALMNWNKLKYNLLWPLVAVLVRATVITYSRGGQLALGLGMLLLAARARMAFFFLFVLPLGLFFAMKPDLLPPHVVGRLVNATVVEQYDPETGEEIVGLDKSSRERIEIWTTSLSMMKARPMLGFGYGSFRNVIGEYNPERANRDAHNAYIRLAVEQGIPAVVLLLVFFVACGWIGLYVYKHSEDHFYRTFAVGYVGGLVGIVVANVFGSRFENNEITIPFWVMTACLAVVYRMLRQEQQARDYATMVSRANRRRKALGLDPLVPEVEVTEHVDDPEDARPAKRLRPQRATRRRA